MCLWWGVSTVLLLPSHTAPNTIENPIADITIGSQPHFFYKTDLTSKFTIHDIFVDVARAYRIWSNSDYIFLLTTICGNTILGIWMCSVRLGLNNNTEPTWSVLSHWSPLRSKNGRLPILLNFVLDVSVMRGVQRCSSCRRTLLQTLLKTPSQTSSYLNLTFSVKLNWQANSRYMTHLLM